MTLAGYVAGADRLLETAAGFVMSSFTEGMPLVLMEALQWGVPVVATAVGAIPELLQDGRAGELVPPDDVEALTRAAVRVHGAHGAAAAEPRVRPAEPLFQRAAWRATTCGCMRRLREMRGCFGQCLRAHCALRYRRLRNRRDIITR